MVPILSVKCVKICIHLKINVTFLDISEITQKLKIQLAMI